MTPWIYMMIINRYDMLSWWHALAVRMKCLLITLLHELLLPYHICALNHCMYSIFATSNIWIVQKPYESSSSAFWFIWTINTCVHVCILCSYVWCGYLTQSPIWNCILMNDFLEKLWSYIIVFLFLLDHHIITIEVPKVSYRYMREGRERDSFLCCYILYSGTLFT